MKYIFYFSTVVLILSGYILNQWPDSALHLVFCDVGQGDSILLSYHSTQVLIDGGKDEKVLACLEKFLPFWDKNIEIIIATHPDADHIDGLSTVFEQYSSNLVVTNGAVKETTDFADFKEALSRKLAANTKHMVLQKGDVLTIGSQLRLSVLSPQVLKTDVVEETSGLTETQLWDEQPLDKNSQIGSNDRSIVTLLEYKNTSMLLTGDLEEKGELSLLEHGLIPDVDILKVGHHGSKTSTSPRFLAKVRPEISVISSGANNTYGHPAPEKVSLLHAAHSLIYRTDQQGTLHFATDGEKIWFF